MLGPGHAKLWAGWSTRMTVIPATTQEQRGAERPTLLLDHVDVLGVR